MDLFRSWKTERGVRKKALIGGALSLALMASSLGVANAAIDSSGLRFSKSSDRSNGQELKGSVSGNIYVFYQSRSRVDVTFYLDTEPGAGQPVRTELQSPYDFAGGSWEDGSALPFDTSKLSSGTHSITAVVESDRTGEERTVKATFKVGSGSSTVTTSTTSTTQPTTSSTSTTVKPTTTTVKPTTTTTVKPTTTTTQPSSSTSWPSASNTGPSGTLAKRSGGVTLGAGQKLENTELTGCVTITGQGAEIKNSLIKGCSGGPIVRVSSGANVTISDSELAGTGDNSEGVTGGNVTLLRSHIHDVQDGVKLDSNSTIQDSWIQIKFGSGCHCDALQTMWGNNTVIRHNRLEADGGNAALQFGTEFGAVTNFLMENNYMTGGGYTINFGREDNMGASSNIVVRNNVFGGGWDYGPVTFHAWNKITFTGNKTASGQAVNG